MFQKVALLLHRCNSLKYNSYPPRFPVFFFTRRRGNRRAERHKRFLRDSHSAYSFPDSLLRDVSEKRIICKVISRGVCPANDRLFFFSIHGGETFMLFMESLCRESILQRKGIERKAANTNVSKDNRFDTI